MEHLKPHISLFDKSFNQVESNNYTIYLQLSKNSLTYTVFNPKTSSFIGLEKYLLNDIFNDYSLVQPIQYILSNSTILKQPFKSFNLAFVNDRSTLIPNAIFNINDLKEYHQFNFSTFEEDLYFHEKLINTNAQNVFSIPDFIVKLFDDVHQVKFHHFSSSIIEAALLNAKKQNTETYINVNLLPSTFQITVVKNQQLEIFNSFNYQTSEDFIYYLLFVFEQLKISPEKTSLVLSGEVEKNSAIYEMLYKYVNKTEFASQPEEIKLSYIFEEIPKHYYLSLFNQYLCE